jgi:hypothetical protein
MIHLGKDWEERRRGIDRSLSMRLSVLFYMTRVISYIIMSCHVMSCYIGYYGGNGINQCNECPLGYTCNSGNNILPVICPPNYICVDGITPISCVMVVLAFKEVLSHLIVHVIHHIMVLMESINVHVSE